MSVGGIETSEIFDAQLGLAKRGALYLCGYIVLSTLVYSVVDIFFFSDDSLLFGSSIVVWALGYLLLVKLISASAPGTDSQKGGAGGYFGLGIVYGLAVGVGLVCFVLPGLYLALRWLPAFARLQNESDGVFQALGWSWQSTEAYQFQLAKVMVGPLLCFAAFVAVALAQETYLKNYDELTYSLSFVVLNLAVSVSVAWSQLLGVVAYRFIKRDQTDHVDTFA